MNFKIPFPLKAKKTSRENKQSKSIIAYQNLNNMSTFKESAFCQLVKNDLTNRLREITAVTSNIEIEKQYQESLKAVMNILISGQITELSQAILDRFAVIEANRQPAYRDKHNAIQYAFLILVEGEHAMEIQIPSFGRKPIAARAKAFEMYANPKVHTPDWLLKYSDNIAYGVVFYFQGHRYPIAGAGMKHEHLLAFQANEFRVYSSRYGTAASKTIQAPSGGNVTIIDTSKIETEF